MLEVARATGAASLFVVGIGKNVGKTVALRALYEAASERGLEVGLTSIGRDGEAVDAGDARAKPRLFLRPGTVVATARDVLPRSPASEIIEFSPLATAAGGLIYARVRQGAHYELVGPPTASGIRSTVDGLLSYADYAIVDGAVDRVAALAGGSDAIVVSCGASAADTMEEVVDEIRALVMRLRIAAADPNAERILLEGAFTPELAARFITERETRQVVLRDPTQLVLSGRSAIHALERLDVRCLRPLHVVATTVASIGQERNFEPRAFAQAVAAATGLPAFDVYAGYMAA